MSEIVGNAKAPRNEATETESYKTLDEASQILGVHTWKLRRAIKAGLVPSYTLLNSRRLVRLSEIVAVIEASREGGDA